MSNYSNPLFLLGKRRKRKKNTKSQKTKTETNVNEEKKKENYNEREKGITIKAKQKAVTVQPTPSYFDCTKYDCTDKGNYNCMCEFVEVEIEGDKLFLGFPKMARIVNEILVGMFHRNFNKPPTYDTI